MTRKETNLPMKQDDDKDKPQPKGPPDQAPTKPTKPADGEEPEPPPPGDPQGPGKNP